jgi:hypothetical protein
VVPGGRQDESDEMGKSKIDHLNLLKTVQQIEFARGMNAKQ